MNRNNNPVNNISQQALARNPKVRLQASNISNQLQSQEHTAAGSSAAALTMINAPTSLANLAQLSGISLLPMGDYNRPGASNSNNCKQLDTKQRTITHTTTRSPNLSTFHRISSSASSATSSSSSSSSSLAAAAAAAAMPIVPNKKYINPTMINQTYIHHHFTSAANRADRPTTTNVVKQTSNEQATPRVFNISSIPSVQSLNQTSNDLIFKRNINAIDHSRSQFNNHTQSMLAANVSGGGGRGEPASEWVPQRTQPKTVPKNNLAPTNRVQVIPVSSCNISSSLQYLSAGRAKHQAAGLDISSDLLTQVGPSEPTCGQGDSFVNVNGDANNISLIKLMAILNNPALTITAVGPKERSNNLIDNNIDLLNNNSSNIFGTLGRQLSTDSRLSQQDHLPLERKTNTFSNSTNRNSSNLTSKSSRMPQSAANIQILHGSQLPQESSGMAQLVSVNNPNSNAHQTVRQAEQKLDDFRPDQLADYNDQDNSHAANIMQGQYPSQLRETTYDTTNDVSNPTMLSTSVRNLLMQQVSQNTSKQQNKSAQLLRHIANQEQRDDDSRSNDRDDLPVVGSICSIPGHYRVVKEICEDVKVVEAERTVSTSGLLKKKAKGPTRTSRYRLYVPGMDNGNLRHSRTNESRYYLNDILIVSSNERQVHLSERHSMLDTMMNLDEDRKKRRLEPTEPDEIFINRSKRVMSKIDSMLERKKKRRFERISGRESPKTNSLEDQCAESEEEWSSDEAMDLDSTSIIKTQLPLEEVETDAKKNHFLSVGLVSRKTKHTIEADQCERRLNLITPLAFEELELPAEDLHQFVDTIVKTNGEDVHMRVESNIKRNELPLVEGLNRNTSRLKMGYMNLLGLEKRSKRTTLYKVKQQSENTSVDVVKQQTDLSSSISAGKSSISDEQRPKLDDQRQLISTNHVPPQPPRSVLVQSVHKLAPTNCRDVMKLQNKNDYMRSLGLMAS